MAKSRSHIPAADRVAHALRAQAGQMPGGGKLPSVRRLMRQFGVSQLTVQQAIGQLENEGLVERQLGRGTFVAGGALTTSRTVTILRSDAPSRRGDEVMRATHQRLKEQGYRPLVVTYCDFDQAAQVLRDTPRPDAYVLQPAFGQAPLELLAFLRRHSDTVIVDGELEGVNVDALITDWQRGLEAAVGHLMDHGHTRIALASGEPPYAWERLASHFRTLCRWAKLPTDPDPLIVATTRVGESPVAGMRERLTDLIREHDGVPFTAMVVNSFASATGALESLATARVRVPDDLSLVVLDSPDLGEDTVVPLTMVGHTSEQIGTGIVRRIEQRWRDPDMRYGCLRFPPELVERRSVRELSYEPAGAF